MTTTFITISNIKNKILSIYDLYKKITVDTMPRNEVISYYEHQYQAISHLFKLYQICEALQMEKGFEAEIPAIEEVYHRLTQWEDKSPHDLRELGKILIIVCSKLKSDYEKEWDSYRKDLASFLKNFRSDIEKGKKEEHYILIGLKCEILNLVDEVEDEGVNDNPILPLALDNLFSLYTTIEKMLRHLEDSPSKEVLLKCLWDLKKVEGNNPAFEHEDDFFKAVSEVRLSQ